LKCLTACDRIAVYEEVKAQRVCLSAIPVAPFLLEIAITAGKEINYGQPKI
jgi:hypothetical protein